jgi:enediyne biosynthesis protein E4
MGGLALCLIGASMARAAEPEVRFVEIGAASGIDFVLANHPTGRKHLIETMPGGLAVFDYDGDGLPDLYFTNGAAIPALEKQEPAYWNRLYRNQGAMRFRDVTEQAGVAGEGYSMGAAAADFDNDGDIDLFVAGVNRNLLYRNNGDGTFTEVSREAGIVSGPWAVAAGWLDYDNDGWLDLFVVNYLDWSTEMDRFCGDRTANLRVYCHPRYFQGLANRLYRNLGNGTFRDVSEETGIAGLTGKGMSLAIADYDGDGYVDVFVTNDTVPNFRFRNVEGKRFEEDALLAGVALTDDGKAISAMGVEAGDVDNDGRPDLSITALAGETFPLFLNQGEGAFRDATSASGLAALTVTRSGWGNCLADFDNDGRLDLATANSHVNDRIERFQATEYRQPPSLFLNRGDGSFRDASRESGLEAAGAAAWRGLVCADLNGDGRLDAVLTVLGERPRIFENRSRAGHWIAFRLAGTRSNRDGIGAVIRLGGRAAARSTAVGYASSHHGPLHFGLGQAERALEAEIRWPSGARQVLRNLPAGQVVEVRESEALKGE